MGGECIMTLILEVIPLFPCFSFPLNGSWQLRDARKYIQIASVFGCIMHFIQNLPSVLTVVYRMSISTAICLCTYTNNCPFLYPEFTQNVSEDSSGICLCERGNGQKRGYVSSKFYVLGFYFLCILNCVLCDIFL